MVSDGDHSPCSAITSCGLPCLLLDSRNDARRFKPRDIREALAELIGGHLRANFAEGITL